MDDQGGARLPAWVPSWVPPWAPLAAASVVAMVGVTVLLFLPGGSRAALSSGDWKAQSVLCAYREAPDSLNQMAAGAVLKLDSRAGEILTLSGCSGVDGPLQLDETRPAWVVATGWDREAVRLVEVDEGPPVELVAEHDVPGEGCATTGEVRGELLLVVQGPPDTGEVRARVDTVDIGCP